MAATASMKAQALRKEGKWKVRLREVGDVLVKCQRPRGGTSVRRRFASRWGGKGEVGVEDGCEEESGGEEDELSRL